MLGHSMGTQHTFVRTSAQSAAAFRGGLGAASLENFTASQIGFDTIQQVTYGKLAYRQCSTRFAIDNNTISTDNSIAYLHWWGTASGCEGTWPSVPQPGYTTGWPSLYIQK